jgi:Sulfotransferase family
MRCTWPFNGRGANGHHQNGNGSGGSAARPDLMCVGAQKAGTTWLYWQLYSHPDFWMPPVKELHYFDKPKRANRVPPRCRPDKRDACFLENLRNLSNRASIDLENYGRLFQPKGPLLSGDITPGYSMLDDELIRQITSYFPKLKVIFLARDPVERAWSQLSMEVRRGWISSFDVTDTDAVDRNLLHPRVLSRSQPSKIVARWKRYVHPDRFRVYFFDDLQRNPTELRHRILDFLGADPKKRSERVPADYNADAGQRKLCLTDKVRGRIAKFFAEELKACAAELGGAAKEWPGRYGFSLVLYFWDLLDDTIDLVFWCDWIF